MDKEYTVHLEGFLNTNYDGELALDDNWSMLSEDIANELKDDEMSHYKEQDQYCTNVTSYYPTVGMSLYVSEEKLPLEEVKEKVLLQAMGAIDIYTEWYGYSEWTIEGYNTINFTVGNHDLEEILRSYKGKYIHVVMDVYK